MWTSAACGTERLDMAITSYTDDVGLHPCAGLVPSSLRTSTLRLYPEDGYIDTHGDYNTETTNLNGSM